MKERASIAFTQQTKAQRQEAGIPRAHTYTTARLLSQPPLAKLPRRKPTAPRLTEYHSEDAVTVAGIRERAADNALNILLESTAIILCRVSGASRDLLPLLNEHEAMCWQACKTLFHKLLNPSKDL